jgi:osmotically-inducible protein OsmY
MKSDRQLKQDVTDELAWEPAVNDTEIGVEVKHGIVTLSGHLHSYAEKYAAERAVQRVSGVKGMAMELDVKLLDIGKRNDTDIAAAARQALEWNALIPQERIKVKVERGWITLSGEVEHGYQHSAAQKAVRDLQGVTGVSDQIVIKPEISGSDIKTKIEAALYRRAIAEAQAITITVSGGKVTLKGSIPTWSERRAIVQAASATPGVAEVVDQLDVA